MCTLVVTGCQKKEPSSNQQTLRLIFQEGDPPSLNPLYNSGHIRCRTLGKLLFEGLTRVNAQGEAELAGASEVNISNDKLQYTFTLRAYTWTDGTPVTAYQYVQAWKEGIQPLSSCTRPDLFYPILHAKAIKEKKCSLEDVGLEALDANHLQITLEHPSPYFLEMLSHPIFSPQQDPSQEPTTFNGPFTLHEWKNSDHLSLQRNPSFWNDAQTHLSEIDILFISDPVTALNLYEKKEIDWIGSPISIIPIEAYNDLKSKNLLSERNSSLIYWMHLNTQHPVFRSKKIRQALSLSLDRPTINQYIFKGTTPISVLPNQIALSSQPFDCDIDQAKQLFTEGLEEIGYTLDTLPTIELSHFNHPRMKAFTQYAQDIWQTTFGLTFELRGTDWNTFRDALERGEYEMGGCNETPFSPDPLDLLERFEPNTPSNISQWINEAYLEKINAAKHALDQTQRNALLIEAEAILREEAPIIVISVAKQSYMHPKNLKGYLFDHSNGADFSRVYFEETIQNTDQSHTAAAQAQH